MSLSHFGRGGRGWGSDEAMDIAAQGRATGMQAAAYLTGRYTLLQRAADICVMTRQAVVRVSSAAAHGTPKGFALRAEACECLFGTLRDKVAFYLGGQPESKGKHLALNVIPEAIAVLDCPNPTPFVHADSENLHNHIQVASETG